MPPAPITMKISHQDTKKNNCGSLWLGGLVCALYSGQINPSRKARDKPKYLKNLIAALHWSAAMIPNTLLDQPDFVQYSKAFRKIRNQQPANRNQD
jgi:hypothetical protein